MHEVQGNGHVFKDCPKNQCNHCQKHGHIKPNCPEFSRNNGNDQRSTATADSGNPVSGKEDDAKIREVDFGDVCRAVNDDDTDTNNGDPVNGDNIGAESANGNDDVSPATPPQVFRASITSTYEAVCKISSYVALIKSFMVDSGTTRNICKHRSWFENSTFVEAQDGRYSIVMSGAVTVGPDRKAITMRSEGFGYVRLSAFLGMSESSIINFRIPCFYVPDADAT